MIIFGIDSSTKRLSIAASSAGKVLASKNLFADKGFLSSIIFNIDELLKKSGLKLSSVDAFCVNTGPGDFTGTRIGISLVKTLGMVLEKPAYGINTLDVFCIQAIAKNEVKMQSMAEDGNDIFIAPLLDVKREEIFTALYKVVFTGSSNRKRKISAEKISNNMLCQYGKLSPSLEELFLTKGLKMNKNKKPFIFLCGTALKSYKNITAALPGSNYFFIPDRQSAWPEAGFLNLAAFKLMQEENKVHQNKNKNISPFYVREFVPFKGNSAK